MNVSICHHQHSIARCITFTERKPDPMDIAATKLELMQRLMSIVDEGTLQRVANFFKKEVPVEEDQDITDEEYAQFQAELAKCEAGELKFQTREESMRMIREGAKE